MHPQSMPAEHQEPSSTRDANSFLFADIRDFTRFTSQHGAAAAVELADTLYEIAAHHTARHSGQIRGHWGDEVLAQFSSASDAMHAAVAIQSACITTTIDSEHPLLVGIGLDTGTYMTLGSTTSGDALNVAARLCSLADAGEVLATKTLTDAARVSSDAVRQDPLRKHIRGTSGRRPLVRLRSNDADAAIARQFRDVVRRDNTRTRARRRRRALAGCLLLAAGLVGSGTWWVASRPPPPGLVVPGNAVAVLDPMTGRLEATLAMPTGQRADAIAVGAASVWLMDGRAGAVYRVDPTKAVIDGTLHLGGDPVAAAEYGGSLWVADAQNATVAQISPQSLREVARLPVGKQPTSITPGFSSLWVTNSADNTVSRIDPTGGRPTTTIAVGSNPTSTSAGGRLIWVSNQGDNTLSIIDPVSQRVIGTLEVGRGPSAVLARPDGIFVANSLSGNVSTIDPGRRVERSRALAGADPSSLAEAAGRVWVGDDAGSTITGIDPATGAASTVLNIGSAPVALAGDGSLLWVATAPPSSPELAGGVLRIAATSGGIDTTDPALTYTTPAWRALSLVYDGLVGFRRAAGPSGLELVPDLAVALPTATAGGLVYAFTLRAGIRYSDGRPLRASDVRRGLERSFTANSPQVHGNPAYYAGIVGGARCLAVPSRCDLSAGVRADDSNNTVTITLTAPDPDFLHKLALPFATVVPPHTQMSAPLLTPIPGTGPYQVAAPFDTSVSHTGYRTLTLVRNPRFRQWSAAAQPNGLPDTITWRPMSNAAAEQAVATGAVDLMELSTFAASPDPAKLRRLAATYHELFHIEQSPLALTHYVLLNTRVAPFSDLRARQALAYALDRRALTSDVGASVVTCQLLPPGFAGYAPRCDYTTNADASGTWKAPNTERAKILAAQTRTTGEPVRIMVSRSWRSAGALIRATLVKLHYTHVTLEVVPDADYFALADDPRHPISVGLNGWGADFPAASDFYYPLLSCSGYDPRSPDNQNTSGFCDPRVETLAARARAAQTADPAAAQQLWQQTYAAIDMASPVIAFGRDVDAVLLSRRANEHYQYSWMYGPLLDQISVR